MKNNPIRLAGKVIGMIVALSMIALDYLWNVWKFGKDPTTHAKALWLQRSARRTAKALNLTCESLGMLPKRGLIVTNHLSYLDILILSAIVPTMFVSKSEVKKWPVFGWFAHLGGTIFVNRRKRADVDSSLQEMRSVVESGTPLVLFAEGTSSNGTEILPFKSSLLQIAALSDTSIHVGHISYRMEDGDARDEACFWGEASYTLK